MCGSTYLKRPGMQSTDAGNCLLCAILASLHDFARSKIIRVVGACDLNLVKALC